MMEIGLQVIVFKKRNGARKGHHYKFNKAELHVGPVRRKDITGDIHLDLDYSRCIEKVRNEMSIRDTEKMYQKNWGMDCLPRRIKYIG